MKEKIKEIFSFLLYGKYACFKNFYSNSSSLTYLIPPRTVLMGIFASILRIPRNDYYDKFSSNNYAISVCIESPLKKKIYSVNYLGENLSFKEHSQCKLELVSAKDNGMIKYRIYLAYLDTDENKKSENINNFDKLKESIKNKEFGYGIYLGQRQFIGFIDEYKEIKIDNIEFLEKSDTINSLCRYDNVIFINNNIETSIRRDNIPIDMESLDNIKLRKTIKTQEIIYEQNGKEIKGEFKNCFKIIEGGKIIGFYEF